MRVYFKAALNFWGLVYLKLANLGQRIVPFLLSVLFSGHCSSAATLRPYQGVLLRMGKSQHQCCLWSCHLQPSDTVATIFSLVCDLFVLYTCGRQILLIVKLNCLQKATPNLLSRCNFDVWVLSWWMNELCVGPGPTELHVVPCSRSVADPQEAEIYCNAT